MSDGLDFSCAIDSLDKTTRCSCPRSRAAARFGIAEFIGFPDAAVVPNPATSGCCCGWTARLHAAPMFDSATGSLMTTRPLPAPLHARSPCGEAASDDLAGCKVESPASSTARCRISRCRTRFHLLPPPLVSYVFEPRLRELPVRGASLHDMGETLEAIWHALYDVGLLPRRARTSGPLVSLSSASRRWPGWPRPTPGRCSGSAVGQVCQRRGPAGHVYCACLCCRTSSPPAGTCNQPLLSCALTGSMMSSPSKPCFLVGQVVGGMMLPGCFRMPVPMAVFAAPMVERGTSGS